MLSEFRKNKLLRGFEFLDTDKSGSIEKADFELAHERLKKARQGAASEQVQKASEFLMKVWEGVKAVDADGDGKVTPDEWLTLWDDFVKNPNPPEWQLNLAKFVFLVLDLKGDNSIDHDEFVTVTTSFGRKKEEAETAFTKIAKGGSSVSLEAFQVLWREYFAAEDVNAPGNFIFGRTTF